MLQNRPSLKLLAEERTSGLEVPKDSD